MSSPKLVVALHRRRRSAFELRSSCCTSASMTQLLARYRRASLQDEHAKMMKLLMLQRNGLHHQSKAKPADEADHNSNRSSVCTDVEDDEFEELPVCCTSCPEDDAVILEEQDEDDIDHAIDEARTEVSEQPSVSHSSPTTAASQCCERVAPQKSCTPRRKFGTVLCDRPKKDSLQLFREQAEYSDYLTAMVTGAHAEMDSVVFYEVDVHFSQMKWKIYRRFSEFRKLRQRLIKHLSCRQRVQQQRCHKCLICADILRTLQLVPFPSRKHIQRTWLPRALCSSKRAAKHSLMIAERKRKLLDFVATCLTTVRSLRQHYRLMRDSSSCEIHIALHLIEEFLGLSFTRFMLFLNERGILVDDEDKAAKARQNAIMDDGRRATIAV